MLALAAVEAGHSVRAFFYMDGVYQCLKANSSGVVEQDGPGLWMDTLLARGVAMTASNRCLRSRGLDPESLLPGVRVGTMEDMARLAAWSNRMVCL